MKPGRIRVALRQAIAIGLLAALAVPGLASAQHQGGRGGGRGGAAQKQQQVQRPIMPPAQGAREATYRQTTPQQQRGRMSDEERRQLKRDISDHGRDIYQDRQGQRR